MLPQDGFEENMSTTIWPGKLEIGKRRSRTRREEREVRNTRMTGIEKR
jgi:hypothetical protein